MKEVHSKIRNNGESGELFKKRFTAERSRQFDILQAKEGAFLSADGCSERASEFSKPGCQLKPSDGRKRDLSIKEHRGMVEKLKDVKEHDSTLVFFQSNGLALKQGEEFAHSLNVKQIKCIEDKLMKVTQDMEALENIKGRYDSIFKGILKQHINKRKRKKENRRKSNERKRKRTENNSNEFLDCVGNPLGNDLSQCLVYPPRLAVPEECIKVEDVGMSLFRRDGPYIAQLVEDNYFINAARSRITTNLHLHVP